MSLAELAGYWPLLLLPALFVLAVWVWLRDRDARRAHPTIEQASHDRGEIVRPEEEP